MSPAFMARYEASRSRRRPAPGGVTSMSAPAHPVIADRGARRQPGRAGDRLFDPANATTPAASCSTILPQGRGERLALTGPAGTRSYADAVRRRRALGPRLAVARARARRPHPDVPRRYAGLSGGVLRRGPRRLRAASDQYADAAGPAAVLSCRFRRRRSPSPMPSSAPASMRSPARTRALRTLIVVNGIGRRSGGARTTIAAERWLPGFPPILPRPTPIATRWRSGCIRRARPDGPRASSICSTTWPIASRRSRSHVLKLQPGRHLLFGAEDVLRLRLRQFDHLSVLRRAATTLLLPGQPKPGGDFRGDRAVSSDGVLRAADALYRADQGRGRGAASDFSSLRHGAVGRRGALGRRVQRLEER